MKKIIKLYWLHRFLDLNPEIVDKFGKTYIEKKFIKLKIEFNENVLHYFKKMLIGDDLDNIIYRYKTLTENKTTAHSLKKFILLYGENTGQEKWNSYREKIAVTEKNMIKKYGEKLGQEKWNSYCEKQRHSNSIEYKQMSKEEFKQYNLSRAITEKNMIKRYGEKLGREKWNSYCEKQRYTNSIEYFTSKYGSKEGEIKWKKYNMNKALTLENFIKKYGVDGENKYLEYRKSNPSRFDSKISQDFFEEINNKLKNFKYNVYYNRKNKEFGKYSSTMKKYNYYDFVITKLNICIEFNGDIWHANPKKYTKLDKPNPYNNQTAEDIWKYDKMKNECIINEGFDLIIVWESDYRKNKEKIISDCVLYITKIKEEYERNN